MWFVTLQRVMQCSGSQKRALFAARRDYLTNLAIVSRWRQALLHKLQLATRRLGLSMYDLPHSCPIVEGITQQLQQCIAQENEVFMCFHRAVGHGVCLATLALMIAPAWKDAQENEHCVFLGLI